MPVYLCQPGSGASEPWRHGIQVYAAPFAMDDMPAVVGGRDTVALPTNSGGVANWQASPSHDPRAANEQNDPTIVPSSNGGGSLVMRSGDSTTGSQQGFSGLPIRRVRHAEVLLVDDVCIAFDRYWLRLRWPGGKGGFAGYIALGKVSQLNWLKTNTSPQEMSDMEEDATGEARADHEDTFVAVEVPTGEERIATEEADVDDPAREEEPQDNASTRSAEPFESTGELTCLRTGITFPSSIAMKLMAVYDDGLSPPVTQAPLPSEPVFCRICREGLHDDADEQQPSPAMENEPDDGARGQSNSPSISIRDLDTDSNLPEDDFQDGQEPETAEPPAPLSKGPVQPHPPYHPNPHAAENPILAPCECSGSMAFVHYMCVEQWRCRSRHPEARQGLQCETCFKPYALPPPSARPSHPLQVENEDWLEAMPPHVMAALRQPHIWWQIGAAIVRRKWLRPIAPVLMSPVVALYCRARRMLKKKGVARRRWACSLCRRRARWKCVRCLRSYYCSRQCQNVSWHIVHKHVCYKPSRWGWSVVVYGFATMSLFPGILRDPLMYDLGLGFVPASFYVMATLGGGFATSLKKTLGLDLRGRSFEVVIILMTLWLVALSWGLVGAFFGDVSACHGVFGSNSISLDSKRFSAKILLSLRALVFVHAQDWFLMWDRVAMNSGHWLRKALCTEQEEGCFTHLHRANADFFLEESDGGRCAADLSLLFWLFLAAGVVTSGNVWKRRERHRRVARRPGRGDPRPHQD